MASDPAGRLAKLLEKTEGSLRRSILKAIREASTDPRIPRLLRQQRYEEAIDLISTDVATKIANAASQQYLQAGQVTAIFLSGKLRQTVVFDPVHQEAVQEIQQNRLNFIREFTQQQRDATRAAITDGITRGLNPRDQARNFRSSVGLTLKLQQWVQNYREALARTAQGDLSALRRERRDARFDRSVRGAARRKRPPLTLQEINRMVQRYNERLILYRSQVIARTEALRSLHAGTHQMYLQAISDGAIDPNSIRRTWATAADERVRQSHRLLNGVKRGINETFPALGGPLRFPGDPQGAASETIQCRCVLTFRFRRARQGQSVGTP